MRRFDGSYYLEQHEAVRERVQGQFHGDALLDYLWAGSHEYCNPSPEFDEAYYLEANPDVAAALKSADFVCGYHHYLKNGAGEGRRGVKPVRNCVVDAGTVPISDRPIALALVSAVQRVRPGWRILVLTDANGSQASTVHCWVAAAELTPDRSGNEAMVRDWQPHYVVRLGSPGFAAPSGAVVVALGGTAEGHGDGGAVVLREGLGVLPDGSDGIDAGRLAERVVLALETAEQVASLGDGRLIARGKPGSIGLGVEIALRRSDSGRVVSVAIELPVAQGVSKELLLLEADGDPLELEVAVGRPAHTAVHVGTDATRILVRPKKDGYTSKSRLAMVRVEALPVDLVAPASGSDGFSDSLAVIDLNTDLARAKRELGRFLAKADAVVSRRPALEFGLPAVPRLAPVITPRCLVVSTIDVERSWVNQDTLDLAVWREYLDARGFAVDTLDLPLDTAGDVGRVKKRIQEDHRFVVVTSPRSPALLTEGLDLSPQVVRVYRGAVSGGRVAAEGLRPRDLACAWAADRLIVDDPDDAAYYQQAGVPVGNIDYVPAFLPMPYRRPARPFVGRPRQLVVHVDTKATLEERILRHDRLRGLIAAFAEHGWRVVISALPRLWTRIEDDLGLSVARDALDWCDPSVDLPHVLHATRLVYAPAMPQAALGGLVSAARVLGFRILLDGPLPGRGDEHVIAAPAGLVGAGDIESLDRDPGGGDTEAVRAEAYRALDRVIGFRDAGWQEGRRGRSPDI